MLLERTNMKSILAKEKVQADVDHLARKKGKHLNERNVSLKKRKKSYKKK
jgi:hypothetical protein